MKRLLLAVLAFGLYPSSSALAKPSYPTRPAGAGLVNDFANIIPDTQQAVLERDLRAFEQKNHAEIAVVSVSSLDGYSVDEYANGLLRTWGIGKKGADNGVLLLVAPNERKVRIEVGYRFEPLLTDAVSSDIIHTDMYASLHSNDFGGGTVKGAHAIMDRFTPMLATENQSIMSKATPKNKSSGGSKIYWAFSLLVLGGSALLFIRSLRKRTQKDREPLQHPYSDTSRSYAAERAPTEPVRATKPVQTSKVARDNRTRVETPVFTPTPSPRRSTAESSRRDRSDDSIDSYGSGFGSSSYGSDSSSSSSDSSSSGGFDFGGGSSGGGGASSDF